MKITDEMIEIASEAYAKKRHPSRWDGEPWGLAGQENHRRAIKAALESALGESRVTPSPWQDDPTAGELDY